MSDPSSPARPVGAKGLLIAGAVLLGSGAAGFLAYRLASPPRSTLQLAPAVTAVATAAGAAATQSRADPAAEPPAPAVRPIPEQLPEIALPGPDGVRHRLSDWHGHPLLINFWATWCEPCRREIPLLKGLRRERAGDGLEVVGIAIDFRDAVQKYAAERQIDYPLLVGEDGGLEAAGAFGMEVVLPFSVFADRTGRVIALKVGELHRDEAAFILDRMGDLDRGQLTLKAAREQIAAAIHRFALQRPIEGSTGAR